MGGHLVETSSYGRAVADPQVTRGFAVIVPNFIYILAATDRGTSRIHLPGAPSAAGENAS